MFNQITVIGPGLLGASICLAVRERCLARRIVVWTRKESSNKKSKQNLDIDHVVNDLEESVVGSDMVILCTPVETIPQILELIVQKLKNDSMVTDVGSVKLSICRTAKDLFKSSSANFIGSHPMAGSEKSGMDYATASLFEDRPCILTPAVDFKNQEKFNLLKIFWENLGMVVHKKTPFEHDRIISQLSHLPHLISSVLSYSLSDSGEDERELAGQGLKDMIRISEGEPNLWSGILMENKENLLLCLDQFQLSLAESKNFIEREDLEGLKHFLQKGVLFKKSIM